MFTPIKRAIDFAAAQDKTLTLEAVARRDAARFGAAYSVQCKALAEGVPELTDRGSKSYWKEVLMAFTTGMTEKKETLPAFKEVCAADASLGMKQLRAHVSKSLDLCGVVGDELREKVTSMGSAKRLMENLALTQVIKRQMADGVALPLGHVLDYVTGLTQTTLQVTGKTIIPVLEEFAVVLECERDPDMEASAVLLARLGACLAKDLTGAKLASRAEVKGWQTTAVAKGDIQGMGEAQKAQTLLSRYRSFLQLHGANTPDEEASDTPRPIPTTSPWTRFQQVADDLRGAEGTPTPAPAPVPVPALTPAPAPEPTPAPTPAPDVTYSGTSGVTFNSVSISEVQRDGVKAKEWIGLPTASISTGSEDMVMGKVVNHAMLMGSSMFLVTTTEDEAGTWVNASTVANFLETRRAMDADRQSKNLPGIEKAASQAKQATADLRAKGKAKGPRVTFETMTANEKKDLDSLIADAVREFAGDRESRMLSMFEIDEGSLVVELRARLNNTQDYKTLASNHYFASIANQCVRSLRKTYGVILTPGEVIEIGWALQRTPSLSKLVQSIIGSGPTMAEDAEFETVVDSAGEKMKKRKLSDNRSTKGIRRPEQLQCWSTSST